MILYNQIGKPVEFSALGKTYTWEGFGSCDVPEELFEHIKLEKLPIGLAPVPPKVKADIAFEAEMSKERSDAVRKLKNELETAHAEAAEFKAAIEAAEKRAKEAEDKAAEVAGQLKVLDDQLRQAKSDAAQFEEMAKAAKKEAAKAAETKTRRTAGSKQGRQSRE